MAEQGKHEIVRFLKRHVYCTLATFSGSAPLATVVVYVSDGLGLYFFSGRTTKKIKNIELNPEAGVSVEGRRFFMFPQAVEMQGSAKILSGREAEKAQKIYFSSWKPEIQLSKRVAKMVEIAWVRFRPNRIYSYGIGTRLWELDPEKQFRRIM